jgi:hypothetical protein
MPHIRPESCLQGRDGAIWCGFTVGTGIPADRAQAA